MTDKKTWFITGAGRGMGVDFAKAALAAGHASSPPAATPTPSPRPLGDADDLLVVKLDVTSRQDAEAAVKAAVDRFGGIDVLVNNAASFYAGYFEELTPEQMERQLATSLVGPMNVTRAVLPVMRKQRSGHVMTISSSAGFAGFEFGTAYAASKFGVEGWMESLAPEVAPFGIHTTIVNPGFFRTELLTKESTNYATPSIADYAERNAAQREFWESQNGQQSGDPAKLAQALLTIADQEQPPRRFIAGADAIAQAEQKSRSARRRSTPSATSRRRSRSTRSRPPRPGAQHPPGPFRRRGALHDAPAHAARLDEVDRPRPATHQLVDRALSDDHALVDDRNVVAGLLHLVEQVRGQEHRAPLVDELADQAAQLEDAAGSRPFIGSSRINSSGSASRQRAMPRRWRMPSE